MKYVGCIKKLSQIVCSPWTVNRKSLLQRKGKEYIRHEWKINQSKRRNKEIYKKNWKNKLIQMDKTRQPKIMLKYKLACGKRSIGWSRNNKYEVRTNQIQY